MIELGLVKRELLEDSSSAIDAERNGDRLVNLIVHIIDDKLDDHLAEFLAVYGEVNHSKLFK